MVFLFPKGFSKGKKETVKPNGKYIWTRLLWILTHIAKKKFGCKNIHKIGKNYFYFNA